MLDVGRPKKSEDKKKSKLVTVAVDEQTLADFRRACELRGTTMSGLIHPVIVQTIQEEREKHPEAFYPPMSKELFLAVMRKTYQVAGEETFFRVDNTRRALDAAAYWGDRSLDERDKSIHIVAMSDFLSGHFPTVEEAERVARFEADTAKRHVAKEKKRAAR